MAKVDDTIDFIASVDTAWKETEVLWLIAQLRRARQALADVEAHADLLQATDPTCAEEHRWYATRAMWGQEEVT